MTATNYPPGVTGTEPQIIGEPDWVTVTLPTSLWDSVVDSLGADYGMGRHSDEWNYTRVGFGGRYSMDVDPATAAAVAHYLESHAGLFSQSFAMDPEDRAEARREANAAARAAASIRKQLT